MRVYSQFIIRDLQTGLYFREQDPVNYDPDWVDDITWASTYNDRSDIMQYMTNHLSDDTKRQLSNKFLIVEEVWRTH